MVIKALFDLIARIEPEIDFMQFKNAKAIIVIYELLDRNVVFYCISMPNIGEGGEKILSEHLHVFQLMQMLR